MNRAPLNLAGLTWLIDVHVLDSAGGADLRKMARLGWIRLSVSDTAITEVRRTTNSETLKRLLDSIGTYPIAMGPMVLDHSTLGNSVLGSKDDQTRNREVFRVLWPTSSYEDDGAMTTGNGRARFRDALHISTTIRYGADGFATNDPGILKAAQQIHERFPGTSLLSTAEATDAATKAIGSVRFHAKESGDPKRFAALPDWPPEPKPLSEGKRSRRM